MNAAPTPSGRVPARFADGYAYAVAQIRVWERRAREASERNPDLADSHREDADMFNKVAEMLDKHLR